MRRKGEAGVDPEFKKIEHLGYDARYDENYVGPGFAIHARLINWYRREFQQDGTWKHSGRPRLKRKIIECRRVLAVSYSFWNRTGTIYVRLWKMKVQDGAT